MSPVRRQTVAEVPLTGSIANRRQTEVCDRNFIRGSQ